MNHIEYLLWRLRWVKMELNSHFHADPIAELERYCRLLDEKRTIKRLLNELYGAI